MATKYTKRDRALAIWICQICALTSALHCNKNGAASALGLLRASRAEALAYDAWSAVADILYHDLNTIPDDGSLDAEAECLLRDGWLPGEPVIRLAIEPHPTRRSRR